jgi:isoleucyl-tRNA synthetase
MKFKKGTRRPAAEYEKDLVQYWKTHQTFEKSVDMRPKDNAFVFYDGPPFITGVPHHGTLLSSIVKDAVPRYQTMKGKRVERVSRRSSASRTVTISVRKLVWPNILRRRVKA